MSITRYTCKACDGVTWNAPNPNECGVCGAIDGIGGNYDVFPCDWCLMAPVQQYGDICDKCAEEESKLRSPARERLCDWCMEHPAEPGDWYCATCNADLASGASPYDWWGGAGYRIEPAVVIPPFADEAESFPVVAK